MDVSAVEQAVQALLEALDAPKNEHTERTAARTANAWKFALRGYETDPSGHLAVTFPVEGDAGLVIVSGITYQSTCAHHLLPVVGTATVAYEPNREGRVVGLSKLARLIDGYARRLTIQEEVGRQVVDALMDKLGPKLAACIITAEHGCMTMRGIQDPETYTTTHAWRTSGDRAAVETEAVKDRICHAHLMNRR